MSIRFRKTFTLLPGLIRLNINRKSVSVSVGPRGLSRTYSNRGHVTTGIDLPGPFSYRRQRRIGGRR